MAREDKTRAVDRTYAVTKEAFGNFTEPRCALAVTANAPYLRRRRGVASRHTS